MDKTQLHDFFANVFDYVRFVPFCVEVLGINRSDLSVRPNAGTPIIYGEDKNEVLEAHVVATVERNNRKIGILIYDLSTKTTITRTIGLRKLGDPLVKWEFDAVIAVFRIKGKNEWRLSFIENLPKDEKRPTDARRYTYVFGHADEFYRTPINNFLDLQAVPYEKKGYVTYKEAFSVEALGNRFFKAYKEIYEDFVEEISGKRYLPVKGKSNTFEEKETHAPSPFFASAFNGDGKSVRDYAKKMMGRLVFLQFLQKKGWMGVPEGESWDSGKGERRYLQRLFSHYCAVHPENGTFNFLEDILEPLFFNALNTKRDGDVAPNALFLTPGKPIRIPFLSGSLFERDALDDKVCRFSRTHFQNLFDLFDQFNFTIDETDPNDAEIGIAPDMLGKIFENLLEDNKDKGAFYTPYEVVKYMCQEALLAYLEERTGLDHTLLEELVRKHSFADDRLPIRNAIRDALESVKICDPAIGSGAFPMGMLHELLACHKALAQENSKSADERRNAFTDIKRHIIANNIYGVDIEQGAVDIARLRFWLALVIDEKEPTPLPNLDYKIVRGNSLCAMYDGEPIDLNRGPGVKSVVTAALREYQELAKAFMDETGEARVAKRREVNLALLDALEAYYTTSIKLEEQQVAMTDSLGVEVPGEVYQEAIVINEIRAKDESSKHMLEKVRTLRKKIQNGSTESIPFFDWQVNRADVLGAYSVDADGRYVPERGFDIIIGNPPYIQFQKMSATLKAIYKKTPYYEAGGDIYCAFYEKGASLLCSDGILCYITSNKWMRTEYGERLRRFFAECTDVRLLLDFAGAKIFDSATVDTNIILLQKKKLSPSNVPKKPTTSWACMARGDKHTVLADLHGYVQKHGNPLAFPTDASVWAVLSPIEQAIKVKVRQYGVPLSELGVEIRRGVLTGLNEAFIVDGQRKDLLIARDPKSAEIIRPILRGRDIQRYGYVFADKWLIATHNGYPGVPPIDVTRYPSIQNWLSQFGSDLEKRADQGRTPYNLRDCAYWSLFDQPKIIWSRLTRISKTATLDFPRFALVEEPMYTLDSLCILCGAHLETLLHILNSEYAMYYFLTTVAILDNGGLQMRQQYVENIPIPKELLSSEQCDKLLSSEDVYDAFHFTEAERLAIRERIRYTLDLIKTSDRS